MRKQIYDVLINTARNKRTIKYKDLAKTVGLDWHKNYGQCRQIFSILGAICTAEDQQGHPLLSAVAVRQDTGRPGIGFFNVARDLGRHTGHDDISFWKKERDKVWLFWSSH
jgi:hypothetical protein